MDTVLHFVGMILHIDKFLGPFIANYGGWVYAVLFLIVFAETGLVIFPFLPGDSLLFIGGAFAATGQMSVVTLLILLLLAAVLGNTVNFLIGRAIGPKVYESNWRFVDRNALRRTHGFYEKHGGKTIVLARFVPVVRTFAPFVAGVSGMSMGRFQAFTVLGAVLWVGILVMCGYLFGNMPFIKQYINIIAIAGVLAAVVPVVLVGVVRMLRQKRQSGGSR